jgi:hypothetical protein
LSALGLATPQEVVDYFFICKSLRKLLFIFRNY